MEEKLLSVPYACAYKIYENEYVVSVDKNRVTEFTDTFSASLAIELNLPYTLSQLQPAETANIIRFHSEENLGLQGTGTIAAIVDTGIDYLNKNFWNEDNTSRIKLIWDQTIQSDDPAEALNYGTIYTQEEINKAITAYLNGGDPYSIVPSKDENGHGTEMAGLVGSKENESFVGGAPKCEFLIIKLREINNSDLEAIGLRSRMDTPIYSTIDLILATRFISEYQDEYLIPTAALISCGTNLTSHQGLSTLEERINYYSLKNGIVFVTNVGNQGASQTHASGYLSSVGSSETIEVNIGENEKNFLASVWILKPNEFSVYIISPTGEVAEPIQPTIQATQLEKVKLVLDESTVSFIYNSYESTNGNEVIYISIENPRSGVWQIRLTANYVIDGRYDIWLPQRPLIQPETKFVNADSYTTLMSPCMAEKAITASFYNQSNNTININSGRGYPISTMIKPELAVGGVEAFTTGLNNEIISITGACVAGAVLCSAVLLVLEWGIIRGNDKNMYSTSVISYLTRGTNTRPGDIYPNPQWGYGILNLQGSFENLRHSESRAESIASLPGSVGYTVYYSGDIQSTFKDIPETQVIAITPFIALIYTTQEYSDKIKEIPGIINIVTFDTPYILTDTSPLSAANISGFSSGIPISLTGTGVITALIDTGIDYLNQEFIKEDDTSRILAIWDQDDNSGTAPSELEFGSEYTSEQINSAIAASKSGGDPYSIVPEKDTIGHGTQCAGIIGARGYGDIKGAAPNCDFLVIKLREEGRFQVDPNSQQNTIPLYNTTDICAAIKYAIDYKNKVNKPMVIFLPLSSNFGSHNGNRPIEAIIDYFSIISNVVFAVGTGNQGNSQTHVSGQLKNTNDTTDIEIQVGSSQKDLTVSIWINSPDKMSVGLISPSGQVIPRIPVKISQIQTFKFIYEGTIANLYYLFPEITSGNEAVVIFFSALTPGIWKIKLFGDYIVSGKFNCWINQRPLSRSGTLLLNSTNFTTLTVPSNSQYSLCCSYYDQNTGSLAERSGVGFTANEAIKPDLACGGVNVSTTNTNNRTAVITGSSAATAVLTGAIALILQWGIVENNVPNTSSEIVRTILLRGTKKIENNTYPNPYTGYGFMDLLASFNAIRGNYINTPINTIQPSFRDCSDNIETRIPVEIYMRLTPHKPDLHFFD